MLHKRWYVYRFNHQFQNLIIIFKFVLIKRQQVALGICNLVSSFFGSYPIAGSFSRSAVNHSSGVRTQAGGVLTGLIVILAIQVLTPVFSYIPQSTLSAIIVAAVLPMIKFGW